MYQFRILSVKRAEGTLEILWFLSCTQTHRETVQYQAVTHDYQSSLLLWSIYLKIKALINSLLFKI